jgi:serine/threonine protein phosphatase PrpC/CRP-like cAMP-binding protein
MGCTPSKTPRSAPLLENDPQDKPYSRRPSVTYNRAIDRVDAIPQSKTVRIGDIQMTYAYVSQRGSYPEEPFKPNQDAYCIHHSLSENGRTDALFAVFDGHGKDGDGCAEYARDNLPIEFRKAVAKYDKDTVLTKSQMETALTAAHVKTNTGLHQNHNVDDSLSGTTAISLYFHGKHNRITISNVGDSRAVLGQAETTESRPNLKALPLSRDQTPYRKDEKARIRKTGARVLSLDQLEGLEPIDPSEQEGGDDFVLGDQIDEGGDPPRVWHKTDDYPGTAFTRSIGDALAEDLGVYAEPEMLSRQLGPEDKILVIASDGVYEFLTNQSVIDICAKFSDPREACMAVVAEAYELWLQYELRTDDITIICIFIDNVNPPPRTAIKSTASASEELVSEDLNAFASELKPVRTAVSKEKQKEIEKLKQQGKAMYKDQDTIVDLKQLATPKTPEQRGAIAEAIKASVMFRNISDEQRDLIFDCMESIKVKAGTWVIRQNTVGDRFYIVDEGTFEVRVLDPGQKDFGDGGNIVHEYKGSPHHHPSFGDLALMHSAPRSASIIAKTDGHLWALHRAAFRQILVQAQDHREGLKKVLKEIPFFSQLDSNGINSVSALMEDVKFSPAVNVIEQGQPAEKFFVVHKGSVYSTQITPGGETVRKTLKNGAYFGGFETGDTYDATVMSIQPTTFWQLDKKILHDTLGPLLRGEDN